MNQEDLQQIREVVEAIVTPRFNKIDETLADHDEKFEAIFYCFDKHEERLESIEKDVGELKTDLKEVKTDVKIIKGDVRMLKAGQQTSELRFDRIEEKVFAV